MKLRTFVRRAGKSAMRKIAVLGVCALVVSACDTAARLSEVKAVAAGVPSLAPFFDENSGLGRDAEVRSRPAHGGLQQGDTPGLYGGTKQPRICDADRLERFLTDPGNDRKAQAWAKALGLRTDQIPEYLHRLTPVLLRHDTLVMNHDYKKGKAVPFNALLQAGIAILVDEHGVPAVKCSCGNPLRPFEGDTSRISVTFENGNEKWTGYDRSAVVAVRPAPRALERLALVDVEDPDRGIERPVGTAGEDDSSFDTREPRAVPHLAGTAFGEASRRLVDEGLAVAFDGKGLPPDSARVTASDPPAGTELRFGQYVTLSVAGGASGEPATPPGSESSRPTERPSSPATSASTPPPPSSGSMSPGPTSSGPTSSGPTSSGPTPEEPSSAPPSSSMPPSSGAPPSSAEPGSRPPPAVTSSPPTVTSAPPTSAPVTSSAPPATSAPATSRPTSAPATSSRPTTGTPTASVTA